MYFVAVKIRRKSKVSALSTGERKARGRFYEKTTDVGMDPVAAIYYAIGLQHGPVPGLQTQESFDKYWDEARLVEISSRWLKSGHHRPYHKLLRPDSEGSGARKFLRDKTLKIAQELFAEAFNPISKPQERIRAQTALLALPCMGLKHREKLPKIVFPDNLKAIEEAAPQLLNEALALPPAQSKNVINTLKWFLAKANPEVYGERVQVNHAGEINMVSILETVREKRRVIEAKRAEVVNPQTPRDVPDAPQLPAGVRVRQREL